MFLTCYQMGSDPETGDLVALLVEGQDGLLVDVIGSNYLHLSEPRQGETENTKFSFGI